MGLNDVVSGERVHIGFFGLRNAGKSSTVNAVTGQKLAVVSEVKGTTTDPVRKAMEFLPIGPVLIIDTPGFDDEGSLGEMRVEMTKRVLDETDVAVLVVDAAEGLKTADKELTELFKQREIDYIICYNKSDLLTDIPKASKNEIYISAEQNIGITELKEMIGTLAKDTENKKSLLGDLVHEGSVVVLVIPIDKAAPKGRLILPEQQTIRDILDNGATAVVVRDTELAETLRRFEGQVDLVITDSQAFKYVSEIVPEDMLMTSFSILFARYKGDLRSAVESAAALKNLKDGDKVLVSEGCTHHRQCGDIGTVKIPALLRKFCGKELVVETSSGREFPRDLSEYAVVLHCGACMLNEAEMKSRMRIAREQGVPMSNYGISIAEMNGILKRAIKPFGEIYEEFKDKL